MNFLIYEFFMRKSKEQRIKAEARDNAKKYRCKMDEKQNKISELITEMALELKDLRDRNETMDRQLGEINETMYCIGGPLNDNKLQYSKEQRAPFHDIQKIIESD